MNYNVKKKEKKFTPEFIKGFHASGHASKSDLRWAIDTIDPDYIIPVHTENRIWFKDNFSNVILLKEGEKVII